MPRCSGDASMPDNEASTRVIEKLNLREGRLRWTVFVASERVRVRAREREREIERLSKYERMNEVNVEENAGKPNERERDCRAVKGSMCSIN